MVKPRKLSWRAHVANAVLGGHRKEYIRALAPIDGMEVFSDDLNIKEYTTKAEQLSANVGWCFAANTAIADAAAAVEIKLYRRNKKGDREEVTDHELHGLLEAPNAVHSGEQLMQLHHTYMNFTGEGYLWMVDGSGAEFEPRKGKLPDALHVLPAHEVNFELGKVYGESTVRMGADQYPLMSVIRDINPDPRRPYHGRSIIAASSAVIDTEEQMKQWNRGLFARGARPSLIFSTNEQLDDDVYERWKQQFSDEHAGTANSHKPLLIEGGDAKPYMLNQQDMDFLNSRKFSRDEILAMWRCSPGILGLVENVNRANLEAGFFIHGLINTRPRLRQFVRQLNTTMVKPFDPLFELDFVDPVPEDMERKLKEATEGVNKIWTFDEVRAHYGEEPLPDGLGGQFYLPHGTATIADISSGANRVSPFGGLTPAGDQAPAPSASKAITPLGVKKKT